ncbi:MAG: hypothetical protein ACF8K1_08745 [Phycisphaerales bacterium JB047]
MDQNAYLKSVAEVIDLELKTSPILKAAKLGSKLKSQDLDWKQFGYSRLKHVLRAVSAMTDVNVGLDETDALSISRTQSLSTPTSEAKNRSEWEAKPLKKAVWAAFVSESLSGQRLIDRNTGKTWLSTHEPPVDAADWVRVKPVNPDEQKKWAKSFLENQQQRLQDKVRLDQSLENDDWYRRFPNLLGANSQNLRKMWNRERSRHVAEHVLEWCKENAVSPDVVFEYKHSLDTSTRLEHNRPGDLRVALQAALDKMTTEELLSLQLPARYLVQSLRPDLLK